MSEIEPRLWNRFYAIYLLDDKYYVFHLIPWIVENIYELVFIRGFNDYTTHNTRKNSS